jgi:hypothetical protein
VAKGPVRIVVLGRSKNKSKQVNNFLREIFTQEIPAEFISQITLKYEDGSSKELDNIEEDLVLDDLAGLFSNDNAVNEIEIIVELDLIHKKINKQTRTLLGKHFTLPKE